MLDLGSERWKELRHAYGRASDIPRLIDQLKTAPSPQPGADSEPWFSLWSALCHQNDVYTASYAAVPHLAGLAASRPPRERIGFLHLTAWIEVCRHSSRAPKMPQDLSDAYQAALAQAAASVLECLTLNWDVWEYRVLLGGLAAFRGQAQLAAAIIDPLDDVDCPACGAVIPVRES